MTIPMQINRKLLHTIFPSNLNLEHPRCRMEVIDRKIEVPMINTNHGKTRSATVSPFQLACLKYQYFPSVVDKHHEDERYPPECVHAAEAQWGR